MSRLKSVLQISWCSRGVSARRFGGIVALGAPGLKIDDDENGYECRFVFRQVRVSGSA